MEGSLRTRKWQGKDGQDRYTTEIVANDMQMLEGKGDGKTYGTEDKPGASTDEFEEPPF